MRRYSGRLAWVIWGLAVLVLVGGAVCALLIWRARSSHAQEFVDPDAAVYIARGVVDNTASIAEDWIAPESSGDLAGLAIKQQESLALLSGEIGRTEGLALQVRESAAEADLDPTRDILEALELLSSAQAELEAGLLEVGDILHSLVPLGAAEVSYAQGREALLSAVESHNQAVDSEPTSFSEAIQEASAAAAALQESMASLEAVKLEGLDLEAASGAVSGLENSAQLFLEACRRGETGDIEGHNDLISEVQSQLSASQSSIFPPIDLAGSLESGLEEYMQPVFDNLEDARALLAG